MESSVNADSSAGAEEVEYTPPVSVGVTTNALLNSQSTPWTINAGASIAAMSSNPSMSQLVVAGREVLKIFSTDTLAEVLNIRFGRVNMLYSSNDVKWNPNESHNHLIATAATNGHVVIWNLNMKGKKLGM
jgi:WD40 repeat protein